MENDTARGANLPAPMPMDEMERMARAIAASKLFGIQTPEQALVLMAICRSEGKDPIQAVKTYHILTVGGVSRPAMRADAMLAEFQARGGHVEWGERTEKSVTATFTHPSCGAVPVTWTIEDAKRAQLTGNAMWTKYPRQMLTARVISEGIRTGLPGVVAGIYTPEEVLQFDGDSGPGRAALPAPDPIVHPPAKEIESEEVVPARQPAPHEGRAETAKPPADAPIAGARMAFAIAAKKHGFDVTSQGKADEAKILLLFNAVMGRPERESSIPEVAAWNAARERLPEYTEALRAEASDAGDEDLSDPFAETEEETRPRQGATAR